MDAMVDKMAFFQVPLTKEEVTIPRLGKVRLLEFDGTRRDEWENYTVQHRIGQGKNSKPDTRGVKAQAIVLSVVDVNDQFMFTKADVPKIQAMPGDILDGLFGHIRRINRLYEEEVKAVEGNSEGEANASTGSASLPA